MKVTYIIETYCRNCGMPHSLEVETTTVDELAEIQTKLIMAGAVVTSLRLAN